MHWFNICCHNIHTLERCVFLSESSWTDSLQTVQEERLQMDGEAYLEVLSCVANQHNQLSGEGIWQWRHLNANLSWLLFLLETELPLGNGSFFGTELPLGNGSFFGTEFLIRNGSFFGTELPLGNGSFFGTEFLIRNGSFFGTELPLGNGSIFVYIYVWQE